MNLKLVFFIQTVLLVQNSICYKPVVIVHGILTGAPSMILMVAEIQMVIITLKHVMSLLTISLLFIF